MPTLIRNAEPGDEEGIVYAGIRGWQNSYSEILPIEFLASLDSEIPERVEKWKAKLQDPTFRARTFVAEVDGKVVGYATGDKNRHTELSYQCEIYAIYVLKQYQRAKLGRKLVKALVDLFVQQEHTSMVIAAFKENHIARRFYKKFGGELVGEKTFEVQGVPYPEVIYGWNDLELLAKELATRA